MDRLGEFTRAYHAALESALDRVGRERCPLHGDPSKIVVTFKASDGFVTFYLPADPRGQAQSGYYGYDYSEFDLNTICQSLTVHRLKIASARIGMHWDAFEPIPPDTEPIPELKVPWIHEDLRQAAVSGRLVSLPGMTVGPIVDVKDGVRQAVIPARAVIWAPTFDFPGIGFRRLYLWTHADFWWAPDTLNLDPSIANEAATRDLLALLTVLGHVGALTPELAQQDAGSHAAHILGRYCDQFLQLADSGAGEEVLHRWLNDPQHHLFLDAHAVDVRSKMGFGGAVSDFVVRRADGSYLLVEIEAPADRIFRQDNSEPTAKFNHACQQVCDWQRYIRDNVHTVRVEQGLTDIYEPSGMVVMGRTRDIDTEAAGVRWRDLKQTSGLTLLTYDELEGRVRTLARSLWQLLRRG